MKDGDDLKLNVIPVFACSGRDSNPYGHCCPQDFLATLAFTQAGFITALLSRCSLDYFMTMHILCLGPPRIVSTPLAGPGPALESHRQSGHFCPRGFCLLEEFYLQGFPCSTLFVLLPSFRRPVYGRKGLQVLRVYLFHHQSFRAQR